LVGINIFFFEELEEILHAHSKPLGKSARALEWDTEKGLIS